MTNIENGNRGLALREAVTYLHEDGDIIFAGITKSTEPNNRKGTVIEKTAITVTVPGTSNASELNQVASNLLPDMQPLNRREAQVDSNGTIISGPQLSTFDSKGDGTFKRTVVTIVPTTQTP